MTPQTSNYGVDIYIGDIDRNWGDVLTVFEWKAFINNGFIAHFKLADHGFDLLSSLFTQDYFVNARQSNTPIVIQFRIRWLESKYTTPWRTALISDLSPSGGSGYGGFFEFIAVDPVSFYINNGDTAGSVYKGKIGGDNGVIMQVLDDYIPDTIAGMSVQKNVTDTTDSPSEYWMMRQDPRTFISSILDWTSSLLPSKTSWIVANGEDESNIYINIQESYTPNLRIVSPVDDQVGPLLFRYGGNKVVNTSGPSDIIKWTMLHDSFMVVLNTKLLTSGISTVSGQYLDRVTDTSQQQVYVTDQNTSKKANPTFGPDRGYTKPNVLDHGWTHLLSVPEFNAGDLGKKYGDYIDGRPRQVYMDMLNMVMRIKITVSGEPRLFDCTDLGRCSVTLKWLGIEDNKSKFMDGNWLLYGWHHRAGKIGRNGWLTDVYLSRLDWNSSAIPGNR